MAKTKKKLPPKKRAEIIATKAEKKPKTPPIKGMPVHFVPDHTQRHFGKPDVPICENYGPQYIGEVLAWGHTNDAGNVTCEKCRVKHARYSKLCRGCGTMITDFSRDSHDGRCPRCRSMSRAKVGILDVAADGVTVEKSYGAAIGREEEGENYLKGQVLAKDERKQYNAVQQAGIQPTATEEEVNMAKTKVVKPITTEKEALNAAKTVNKAAAKVREDKSDKKIKMLVKENPKRVGSRAFDVFACYKDGITVAEFLKASAKSGGSMANVNWDVDHEFIKLS